MHPELFFQFRDPSKYNDKIHIRLSAVEGVIEEPHAGEWFLTLHMASGHKVQIYVTEEERQKFFEALGVNG